MNTIENIRDMITEKILNEITNNADKVCTKELGEAVDMVKDLEETIYYMKVVEAMEAATPQEIIEKALPNAK